MISGVHCEGYVSPARGMFGNPLFSHTLVASCLCATHPHPLAGKMQIDPNSRWTQINECPSPYVCFSHNKDFMFGFILVSISLTYLCNIMQYFMALELAFIK